MLPLFAVCCPQKLCCGQKSDRSAKNTELALVLLRLICYTNMVYLDFVPVCRHLQGELDLEKLTYTHNEAAAKVLASFYDTPPLAYVRSYGCPCSRV